MQQTHVWVRTCLPQGDLRKEAVPGWLPERRLNPARSPPAASRGQPVQSERKKDAGDALAELPRRLQTKESLREDRAASLAARAKTVRRFQMSQPRPRIIRRYHRKDPR